ncbi:HET-domain-containing protein [Polyplosphaeria fusca]|uniref:HET-domain-containing protein n=1 Tax=Polyplosphaeria fusca TaxID=682080 RepID=A0A9P4V3D8_9PLEO|nr:HET-domain-containing protein [Polyplosphaeria fusca]
MALKCAKCTDLSVERLVYHAEEEFQGGSFPKVAYFKHHDSLVNLETSADKGCALCRLILRGLHETRYDGSWVEPGGSDDSSMYSLAEDLSSSDIKIAINSSHIYSFRSLEEVHMFDTLLVQVGPPEGLGSEHSDPYANGSIPPLELSIQCPRKRLHLGKYLIGRGYIDPDLAAPSNFGISRKWLHDCQNLHEKCLSQALQQLPSRVIDVGPADGSQPPRLMLSLEMKDEYTALSHCWGGKISSVLLNDNIESYQHALPYESFPANFQHAIAITRHLGKRYLWIDSLCIIQDSKRDWEIESKKMYQVYRNSTLTISAMASRSSTHGILTEEPIKAIEEPPICLSTRANGSENEFVHIERMSHDEESLRSLDISAPLSRRGWVLQESVLSPRLLYYGSGQIYWRCPRGYQSANRIPPGNKTPDYPLRTLSLVLYHDILSHPFEHPDVEILFAEYYQMVSEYSHRRLTFDSDKLPAFSGLCQGLQSAIGGDYLAGHWTKDFGFSLLWYSQDSECRHVHPYRAPS